MQHDGSAFLSTKKAIEAAEDRGFDAGREVGIAEGINIGKAISAEGLEANGFEEAAEWLRKAKIERTDE